MQPILKKIANIIERIKEKVNVVDYSELITKILKLRKTKNTESKNNKNEGIK